MNTLEKMAEELQSDWGVSEETIDVVSNINGYTEQTMYDILYAVAGENTFNFEEEEEEEEE